MSRNCDDVGRRGGQVELDGPGILLGSGIHPDRSLASGDTLELVKIQELGAVLRNRMEDREFWEDERRWPSERHRERFFHAREIVSACVSEIEAAGDMVAAGTCPVARVRRLAASYDEYRAIVDAPPALAVTDAEAGFMESWRTVAASYSHRLFLLLAKTRLALQGRGSDRARNLAYREILSNAEMSDDELFSAYRHADWKALARKAVPGAPADMLERLALFALKHGLLDSLGRKGVREIAAWLEMDPREALGRARDVYEREQGRIGLLRSLVGTQQDRAAGSMKQFHAAGEIPQTIMSLLADATGRRPERGDILCAMGGSVLGSWRVALLTTEGIYWGRKDAGGMVPWDRIAGCRRTFAGGVEIADRDGTMHRFKAGWRREGVLLHRIIDQYLRAEESVGG